MARTDARLSSVHKAVKSKASESDSAPRSPSPDDSILATGSEEDEFASGFLDDHEDGESSGATENEDEDDDGTVENHGLGIGVWQPDEWDGGSGDSEEESEEEDAVANDQQEMSRLVSVSHARPFVSLIEPLCHAASIAKWYRLLLRLSGCDR